MQISNLSMLWQDGLGQCTMPESSRIVLFAAFEGNRPPLDGLLLGKWIYMIRPWLMIPVQRPTTWPQRRYNFAHSFTHTTVQRNIGWYGKTEVALSPLWSAFSATKGMQGYPGLLHAAQLCQTSQTPTSSSQF